MIQKFPENDSTAMKLAKIIYEAMVRHTRSKNSITVDKIHICGLTFHAFGEEIKPAKLTY